MDSDSAVKSEKTAPQAESIELAESQIWDAHSTKKLLRKLDWHIIPFMSLIYLYVLVATHDDPTILVPRVSGICNAN